jgi:hypothetical protein
MPSQIKVDEIKNVAGQYEIKTNTFKGQTTGGSIAVQGEGTATTNMQQGLLKVWVNFDGGASGAASRDSFNVSGMTDGGTGVYTIGISNAMGSINFCFTTACQGDNDYAVLTDSRNTYAITSTTACPLNSRRVSDRAAVDNGGLGLQISGDLA